MKWLINFTVLFLSLYFLVVGINTLIGSYRIDNPMEFVMYFFSSSLLILVCLVGIIFFFFRIFFRKQDAADDDKTP